jgi:hypothetical protein
LVDAIFIDSLLPSDEGGGVLDIVHGNNVIQQIFDFIANVFGLGKSHAIDYVNAIQKKMMV